MEALHEVGFKKIIRFFFYTVALIFFKSAVFPPVRTFILRLLGAQVGKGTVIHNISFFNAYYQGFNKLKIGNYCYLGPEVMIDLAGSVTLEDHVTLSNRVLILTHTNVGYKNHPLQKQFPRTISSVVMKKGSFIGANATILPGVTIGTKSAIAAGAVVIKNVAPKTLVGGVPAKVIKKI